MTSQPLFAKDVKPPLHPTHEYLLDNGLKIIVREDHRAPIAVSQIWYKVGSTYEYGGITGLSHMLEHMMFKGTKRFPNNTFSEIIFKQGGQHNAFTSKNATVYYQTIEASRLPIILELEADRMRNIVLTETDLESEVEVVQEERRMRIEDNPDMLTYERLLANAFISNPYRNPVIGWMNDIQNYTLPDLTRWYNQWYAPNNAILVVVGDVEPEQVYKWAKQYFGKVPAAEMPEVKPQLEAPALGEIRTTIKRPAEVPFVMLGFVVPSLSSTDVSFEPYALVLLSDILINGKSARLPKHLIREQHIATHVSGSYNPIERNDGLFMLYGAPVKEASALDLEKAIEQQISILQTTPVSTQELKRVINKFKAEHIFAKDTIVDQAEEIGHLESVGLSWTLADDFLDKISHITPEQIQAVARKYLTENNRTVAILEPQAINSELTNEEGEQNNE